MAAQESSLPRVRVAAFMLHEGRIVVVRHRKGDATYHLLPGGGLEWGESLEEALVREVAEETGLVCDIDRILTVNDTIAPDGSRHLVNITFAAEIVGGGITDAPEDPRVEAVELIDPDDLASLDLRPPIAARLLAATDADSKTPTYLGTVFAPESDDSGGPA